MSVDESGACTRTSQLARGRRLVSAEVVTEMDCYSALLNNEKSGLVDTRGAQAQLPFVYCLV